MQKELAAHLLVRALEAHAASNYETFDFASGAYDETKLQVDKAAELVQLKHARQERLAANQ